MSLSRVRHEFPDENRVKEDRKRGTAVFSQHALLSSTPAEQFDGFLDRGDVLILASLEDDGTLEYSEEDMVPDAERIRGILNTAYRSIDDFDHAIDTFDRCMRTWQERLSILGKVGSSDSVLESHFKHLATARQLRTVLAQVQECNSACEILMQKGDYLSAISDLTESLGRLQETEAALRGRDDLRISLLDFPQQSYGLLQLALVQTGRFEEALTVCVQAKARSLSHTLEQMDRSHSERIELSVGSAVRIHGLQNDLQYEGRIGTVEQVGEIVLVDVSGHELRVRRQNLLPVHGTADETRRADHHVWHGSQAYLPDMEWGEVQQLAKAQESSVIEYFLFSEHSLGIWLIDRSGQISGCKTVNIQEQTKNEHGCSFTRLLEQTRAAMGVAGRQATSLHSEAVGKDRDAPVATDREIDDCVMDHLVLLLENQSLDDHEDILDTDKVFLNRIQGTSAEQILEQARFQCRDVRAWLGDFLQADPVFHGQHDQVNKVVRAAISWQQVKSWTSHTLLSDFGIQDTKTRSELLERLSQALNPENLLHRLYSLLIEPIADAMSIGHELLIVPHGVLFGVPWAALMDSAGHFLIEKHAIRLAPSLRVAAAAATPRLHQPRCPANHVVETRTVQQACVCDKCAHQYNSRECKLTNEGGEYYYCNRCRVDMCTLWSKAAPAAQKAVVVGNPWPNSCGELPFAEAEADKTCSALQQSEIFETVKIATTSRATKAWVEQHLDQASWVHLACHGKLETNSLVLARDDDGHEELSLLELQSQITLRSGCTVVLSACNTGMGQICGEGVVGLARGVLAAGGGAAVVSLWSISDESTKALMAHMYSFLVAGLDVPQALRHAMLKMLHREPLEEAARPGSSGPETVSEDQDDATKNESCLRSFTNKQGKAELEALKVLFAGGRAFLVDGRPLAVGNGLDERGMITRECCRSLFGVFSYPQVWSERGPALRRAIPLGSESLRMVLLHVNSAISIRAEAKGIHGADAGHDYILQQLRGAKAELKRLLRACDSDSKESLRGRANVTLEKAPTWNAVFAEPKYWASFVVTGARTTLPSPTPKAASAPGEPSEAEAVTGHPVSSSSSIQVFLVLSLEMVCERLREIGLAQYCDAFEENSIDGSMLDELENLWDELGVDKKAHRIKILKAFGLR